MAETQTNDAPGTAVAVQGANRLQKFIGDVLPPTRIAEIKRTLPSHVSFDLFERNLANAVMNNLKLIECQPHEVFREVAKLAALGLLVDLHLGEAYLITKGKPPNVQPQARVGYRGLIKLGRQSGDVVMVYAHEVREHDEVAGSLGTKKFLDHKPDMFGDRGRMIGVYAVAEFKDGRTDFEPMTMAEVEEIRDNSDGYKAYKAKLIQSSPWVTSFVEMAKKTAIRRLMKRLPMSPQMAAAMQIEDQAQFGGVLATPAALARSDIAAKLVDGRERAESTGEQPKESQKRPDTVFVDEFEALIKAALSETEVQAIADVHADKLEALGPRAYKRALAAWNARMAEVKANGKTVQSEEPQGQEAGGSEGDDTGAQLGRDEGGQGSGTTQQDASLGDEEQKGVGDDGASDSADTLPAEVERQAISEGGPRNPPDEEPELGGVQATGSADTEAGQGDAAVQQSWTPKQKRKLESLNRDLAKCASASDVRDVSDSMIEPLKIEPDEVFKAHVRSLIDDRAKSFARNFGR